MKKWFIFFCFLSSFLVFLIYPAQAKNSSEKIEADSTRNISEEDKPLPYLLAQKNSEFEEFLKQRQKEFYTYKKSIEEEFKEYKRIFLEEFQRYKKEVARVWGKAEVTTKKKWVEYSPDYKVRKIVDFEKGEIEVSVIVKDEKEASRKLTQAVKSLLIEDKQTALKKDILIKRVEKRLKASVSGLKTGKVEKEKILTPIFFKKTPTQKEISRKVREIFKKARKEVKKAKNKGEKIYTIKFKLPPKALLKKAEQYKDVVQIWADKRKLPMSLIFAFIHTESSFNPLARSPVPAYGLMQIVPQTAGKDATRVLYGKPKLLAPSYLYNSQNNIIIGTTFFYLLYYHYFKGIKDPKSRLYCSIAAYNTGVGNVAKALTGTYSLKKAIRKVNGMSSEEVYKVLLKNVPMETKNYLKYVLRRMKMYEKFL